MPYTITNEQLKEIYKFSEEKQRNSERRLKNQTEVKDIFKNEKEYKDFVNTIHGFYKVGERDIPFCMYVLAKKHILDEMNISHTPETLVDLSNDSDTMKKKIHDYLIDITKDKKRDKFNREFFKPGVDALIDMLVNWNLKNKNLSIDAKEKKYPGISQLLDGLSDAYGQGFNKDSSTCEPFTLEESLVNHMKISAMVVPGSLRNKTLDVFNAVLEEDAVDRLEFGFAPIVLKNIRSKEILSNVEIAEKNANKDYYEKTFNPYVFLADDLSSAGVNKICYTGVLGSLEAGELRVFLMDPVLNNGFHVEVKRKDGSVAYDKIHFGNMNLDCNVRLNEVDPKKVTELKKIIHAVYRSRCIQKNAALEDFSKNSLRKNMENLREAGKLLSDNSDLFRSSDEYRKMETKLKDFSAYSEKLLKKKKPLTFAQKHELHRYAIEAHNAVKAYLEKKNALNDRQDFKNSYEAKRVNAARVLLEALDEKKASVAKALNHDIARNKLDRYIAAIKKVKGDFVMSRDEKEQYCNSERVILHEEVAAKVKKAEETAGINTEKQNVALLNQGSLLNADKLNPALKGNSMDKIAKYASDHYATLVANKNMAEALGQINNEKKAAFDKAIERNSMLSKIGVGYAQLMKNDHALLIPVDEMIRQNITKDDLLRMGQMTAEELGLTDEEKDAFRLLTSHYDNLKAMNAEYKDEEPAFFTTKDFPQVMVQRDSVMSI